MLIITIISFPTEITLKLLMAAINKFNQIEGEFIGQMKIGYGSMSFGYDSVVSYRNYDNIISLSQGNNVFDELYSKWNIQPVTPRK